MAQLPPKFPSSNCWQNFFFSSSSASSWDEEQLMSMFSDDAQLATSAPSTPSSDQNSASDQDKLTPADSGGNNEQNEAQSLSLCADTQLVGATAGFAMSGPKSPPHIVDPKRVKRILANRQSAQRSRVRKLQYISDLEKSVNALQMEVSALSPRVAFFDHRRTVLTVDNGQLKQRLAVLAQEKLFKDAQLEVLQNEIERLRHVYHQQNMKKMVTITGNNKKLNIPVATDHDLNGEC